MLLKCVFNATVNCFKYTETVWTEGHLPNFPVTTLQVMSEHGACYSPLVSAPSLLPMLFSSDLMLLSLVRTCVCYSLLDGQGCLIMCVQSHTHTHKEANTVTSERGG